MIKEKKHIRREYVQIGIAVVILLLLTAGLIYLIFFDKKDYKVIVPDLPKTTELEMGMVDFEDAASDKMDLNSKKTKKVDINYKVISDFYKKGIILYAPQINYSNNKILMNNYYMSDFAYVSSYNLDGTVNFISVVEKEDYDKVSVFNMLDGNDCVYAFAAGTKGDKSSIIGLKYTNDGKKVFTKVLKEKTDMIVTDSYITNDGVIVVSKNNKDINVLFLNKDLEVKNNFTLSTSGIIELGTYDYPVYCSSTIDGNNLIMVMKLKSSLKRIVINISNMEASISNFEVSSDEEKNSNMHTLGYLNGFVFKNDNSIYKTDNSGSLINKMNYDKVKPDKIPDNYFTSDPDKTNGVMDETVENYVSIRDLTTSSDLMLISGNTLISYLYDIYDNNLNIKKRYLIPAQSHQVSQGILLKTLYVNNKIYEIYSFGEETPSIMIAEIA